MEEIDQKKKLGSVCGNTPPYSVKEFMGMSIPNNGIKILPRLASRVQ